MPFRANWPHCRPTGRLFTIGLIVTGVGSAIYLFTVIGELVGEGRLRDFLGKTAMSRRIHNFQEHVIVCGYGRFGHAVVEELTRNAVPILVIEADPTKQGDLETAGALHVMGSALEDSVLEDGGISAARAIIVAIGSDADNVLHHAFGAREKPEDSHLRPRRLGCGTAAAQVCGSGPGGSGLSMGRNENRGEHRASIGSGFSATLGAGPRVRGRSGGDQDLTRKPGGREDNRRGGTGASASSDSGDEAQRSTARDDSRSRDADRGR